MKQNRKDNMGKMKKGAFSWLVFLMIMLGASGCSGVINSDRDVSTDSDLPGEAIVDFDSLPQKTQEDLLAEREELEDQRREELGEFYVSLPPLGDAPEIRTVKAKGLYLTANVAGFSFNEADIDYYASYIEAVSGKSGAPADTSRMDEINKLEKALAICKSTEINALVIDIKNDSGSVSWASDIGIVNRLKSNSKAPLKEYDKLMDYLKQNDIYCIARVVAFKDPYFAGANNEHAIQLKSGGVYRDDSGTAWVNPFDEYVWKYLIAISREAALRGFDEIQFDYVRFPDGAAKYNPITEFPGRNDRDKDECIEAFLAFAEAELEPYNVHVAADVFGIATRSWDDKPEDIGQTWRKIACNTEYICPMIYPSHYGPGLYGFAVPDRYPYEVVRMALMEGLERNAAQKEPAVIRPWYQGFTASWIKGHIEYDAKVISDQIVAGMELGIDEYLIWNAVNNYDPMTFFYHDRIGKDIGQNGTDILGRSPEMALDKYLEAEKRRRSSHIYMLTPIAYRDEDYDAFASDFSNGTRSVKSYQIRDVSRNEDGTCTAIVDIEYAADSGTETVAGAVYEIVLEKNVYKIIAP